MLVDRPLDDASRRLDAVLNNATVSIFLMNERQHCVYMNPAAERLTGFTLGEVLERDCPLHDIIHHRYPDGRPFPLQECAIDRAFPERARMQGEETFVHRDGHFYPVAFTASPMKDAHGETVGTIIEVRDIAEERAAAEAIHRNEERWRITLNAIPQMVWSALADGEADFFNDRWYEFLGFPPGSSLEDGWTEFLHPDDREKTAERWGRSVATGETLDIEYRLRAADGAYRWTLVRALPVRDADGEITRWMGTCTDIHELKLAQTALEEATERLREANAAKETLLYEVNHRVKNSLQTVASLLAIQARQADPDSAALLRDATARVHVVSSLHQKLYQTGDHDRLEVSNFLRELAQDTMRSLGLGGRVDLRFSSETEAVMPSGKAVPVALVISELVTNAAKYAFGDTRPGLLTIELSEENGDLVITVADDGPGLPPDFDPRQSKGLGMKIVSSLSRQLRAKLTVNPSDRGASFTVAIPGAPEAS